MNRDACNDAAGTVYLVGAGPGAADLLTVRAVRLLERADIVFHDALVDPAVLDLAPRARLVPVGKRCGAHATAQHFINRRLVDAARRHAVVVRLKGGDPMVFGRAQEEIDALTAAGVPVQVVPGVTAACAAAAGAARSLTVRGRARSLVLVTPRTGADEPSHAWAGVAAAADTVALYMASRDAQGVTQALLDAGVPPSRPVLLVESASTPRERVLPARLADLPRVAASLGAGPALLLVGEQFDGVAQRPAQPASPASTRTTSATATAASVAFSQPR